MEALCGKVKTALFPDFQLTSQHRHTRKTEELTLKMYAQSFFHRVCYNTKTTEVCCLVAEKIPVLPAFTVGCALGDSPREHRSTERALFGELELL